MQAGLPHEGQKADGFEGDGLAAGVGAGDNQRVVILSQRHVNGNHLLFF